MKYSIPLALALLAFMPMHAQKTKNSGPIASFGNVDKADLLLKECPFDKKAEAMVLFESGEMNCLLGTNGVDLELEKHIRIKILSMKGKDQADIHLRYRRALGDQDIRDLSAQTYNLDAGGNIVVTKVDKKNIYEKQLNKRYYEKVFTFPEVKEGSIIEYKYKLTGASLYNWNFQHSIPVKYSQFVLDFPNEIILNANARCSLPYEHHKDDKGTRTVDFFSMTEVPALRDEPYILNEDDYLERVESRPVAFVINGKTYPLTSTWPRIVRALMEDDDFGSQLKKDIPRTADLDAELKIISGDYNRMMTIYRYVQKHMTWNGYTSIWALDGVKSAWKDGKGTVGEINLILTNLLKDAGIKAHPVLVSTHDNGLINTLEPGYEQFNKVLAYVTIGDKVYVLDATQKDTPPTLIPEEVLLTEGLVIEKPETFEWGWKTLWDPNETFRNQIHMNAMIDSTGTLSGNVEITSSDYARVKRAAAAQKGAKEFTEKFLSTPSPNVVVDSVSFSNLETDTLPLLQHVYFTQPLSASGEYRYFSANLFSGLESNPFVADTRFSDIFFGSNQTHVITGSVLLPEGYVADGLPQNMKMRMPDTSIVITRMTSSDEISISFRYTLEFRKPFYTVGEYDEVREFYKKLQDMLNEQFVIRRKTRPKP